MSDLNQVLKLWQQIEASGEDCVLATIVRVEGFVLSQARGQNADCWERPASRNHKRRAALKVK